MKKNVGIIGVGQLGKSVSDALKSYSEYEVKSFDISNDFPNFTAEGAACCNILVLTVPGKVFDQKLKEELSKIKVPLIVASTACDEETYKIFNELKKNVPVVMSSNFATHVNKIFKLVASLSEEFSFEKVFIKDIHHTKKKDNSGTAKRIAEIISKNMNRKSDVSDIGAPTKRYSFMYEGNNESTQFNIIGEAAMVCDTMRMIDKVYYGDQAIQKSVIKRMDYIEGEIMGKYSIGKVELSGIRKGDEPGRHLISMENESISIMIEHRAKSRNVFADGIVEVIKKIEQLDPDLYDTIDIF